MIQPVNWKSVKNNKNLAEFFNKKEDIAKDQIEGEEIVGSR